MGVTLIAANSLAWFAKLVRKSVTNLLDDLEGANVSRTNVVFLPYLNGERTPHNDTSAYGQFIGLSHDTAIADMVLAILEGVAFSLLDCQNALISADTHVEALSLIGGGALPSR
ncbi:FGGY-family carbohydrate kinase [Marinomonas sp.]|nr:FGGY-family carbohydrate kinase [Marinomonas sp.]MDB4837532.1 FGGY-family carbohydrate kinase [Marinomonas sp.]